MFDIGYSLHDKLEGLQRKGEAEEENMDENSNNKSKEMQSI